MSPPGMGGCRSDKSKNLFLSGNFRQRESPRRFQKTKSQTRNKKESYVV